MIKVNIGTEISPIVGSKEQAEDLMAYIKESTKEGNVWETNIFGKPSEILLRRELPQRYRQLMMTAR